MRHLAAILAVLIALGLSLALLVRGLDATGVLSVLGVAPQRTLIGLFVTGLIAGLVALPLGPTVALWSVKARDYGPDDVQPSAGDLRPVLARLAAAKGLKAPTLAIYPEPEPTAFAVAYRRQKALLLVSSGLATTSTAAEAEAILAQAVAKIASGDTAILLLLHSMVSAFTIYPARLTAFILGTSLRTFEEDTSSDTVERGVVLLLEVVAVPLATLMVRLLFRQAESRADRSALAMVGGTGLAAALRRLDQVHGQAHREIFIGPYKFGANPAAALRHLSYHRSPTARRAALALN